MKITKTAIGNHLRRSPNGDVGMYRNGFKDGVNWTLQKAQAQAADCGCIDQRDCTGECMKKAQTAKPGDIRALKHRIHELEGEVIGYKQILDGQATPPQHQAAMEALRKANIDCVNHFDAIKEDYDKAQAAMKLALEALRHERMLYQAYSDGAPPHITDAIAALEGVL